MAQLAIVTGASTGIGRELAKCCAHDGYDLIVAADEPTETGEFFSAGAGSVEAVQCDLGTREGVQALVDAIGDRPVALLIANAGRTLGHAFLDQDFARAKDVVDLNVTGTISLIHAVGQKMRAAKAGRILITGSIVAFIPGTFQAVYNGSKAFLHSFSHALRDELKDTGVTVTSLLPGATETEVFERGDMQDTPVGKAPKADPAKVARDGYDAMMRGDAEIVSGFMNKMQTMFAGIIPDTVLAAMHRKMAAPPEAR